ncbi:MULTISPECIES: glycosyltransferase family 4 protein [unclassified Pseudoalteromonas]|uniref:glycosyltransferase family 4 protein n=1 Tax=unclassified Pseudoalteromonas TaxID=194690 RepID=UPI002359C324|nr:MULTISPECIES: glycosyltransferase family 4 protein [unclassified Pseudoalteromonas]MDC9565598.1 glycosyltransferase family 4 protein [Pseudoalteromonas sp. GAB2316C]MDC9569897.1 glycosyltransferase family 4 protein [Pseudoalteromonas sp. GABNB9D]MDC9574040.1 glycosyltransferase family 4 protein [Pseudoalteromonas sp. GABNS16A]MDC9578146.1 glycosyltransferase family 4 protein [Pseudoalteromonas sp. GABNS16E]MDC9584968.1 glycosyltransferase family 4 protein [Pseudoalteromonas sp. GABNS16C]
MKVIIISPSSIFGGGENHIVTLVNRIRKSPISVYCLNEELFNRLQNIENVKAQIFKTKISLFFFMFSLLFSKGKHIVLNGLSESRFLSLLFIFKKYTLISHSAEEWGSKFDVGYKKKLRTKINCFLLNYRSKQVVTVCEYARKNLCLNLPSAKITLIYNTTDRRLDSVKHVSSNVDKPITFGYLGRLSEEKGIHVLLSAINNINCSKDINIVIAGSGKLSSEINFPSYSRLGINVEYLGFVDSDFFFSSVDCLLLPSLTEACPLVVIEAMSKKVPTIASDVGGVPELVQHGVSGYLFPKEDSLKLSQYIEDIVSDERRLEFFKKNAELIFESKFNPEVFVKKYNEVLFNE